MSYYAEGGGRLKNFLKFRVLKPQTEEEKQVLKMSDWINRQRVIKMDLAKQTALLINEGKLEEVEEILRIVKSLDSIDQVNGLLHQKVQILENANKNLKEK